MWRPRSLLLAACAALTFAAPTLAQAVDDRPAIRETVLDYVEGWYQGDAERMRRALHPDLAKRISTERPDGTWELGQMSADELVEAAGAGGGRHTPETERRREVRILDVFGNAATVRARMGGWVDYMHLAKVNGRWVIVNVLWEMDSSG